ncbi:uncharacterized protein N7484_010162 [Penicillium longicatenatum]|uniref:uncharacterized protein n=1 Tax=Penicillium longicatenatum TaxID=1561947 RepID=UPI002547BF41|nr:uncharacterized protein N7484_010162 [Penicillium longicatenatum]KAJ5636849.1 hypothetical protein N7484_010162 [Penicillium longicatenatum]
MGSLGAPRDPTAQLDTVCPLADSLYNSTRLSTSLVSQAASELGLLLTVLASTKTNAVLCTETPLITGLPEILECCRAVLLDLQTVSSCPGGAGSQLQITEIRSRLGSIIFELSMMNANMAISSQNNVNKAMRSFIDDIHAGKRDALLVLNALDLGPSRSPTDEAWQNLQHELVDVGIAPELSHQDHDFIISVLDKAVKDENLLQSRQAAHIRDTPRSPRDQAPRNPFPRNAAPTNHYHEVHIMSDTDKIALPRGLSDLPISVTSEMQADADKQVLQEEFPEPVLSATYSPGHDTNDENFCENFPMPLEAEPGSSTTLSGTYSDASSSRGSSSYPNIVRTKKPNIMRKMKFKFTTSKDEFIAIVKQGGLYAVQSALNKGADVNTRDSHGQTALMVAILFSQEHIVDLLLEYDANTALMSAKGDSALSIAASRGAERIVRTLLVRGAAVDGRKNLGNKALSQAAEWGHENVVRLLFNAGADINGLSHTGDTALSQAAMNGHLDIVRFLLDNGALPDHTAYPRKTALYKAVEQDRPEVVRVLLQHGADPNLPESIRAWTPLTLAAMHGRTEMLAMLNYGTGLTPYQYKY